MTICDGLEHKFCRPDEALTVTDGAVVAGYASVFGRRDGGGDVVLPGAYAASLGALRQSGRRVKMLWQHDPAQPIGVWDEVREDARGLWVKGRLLTDVARGREAAALLAAGAIDGLSIGYRARRATRNAEGGRQLQEIELWEVSLVTFPMHSDARVAAKAGAALRAEEAFGEIAAALGAARTSLRALHQRARPASGRRKGVNG